MNKESSASIPLKKYFISLVVISTLFYILWVLIPYFWVNLYKIDILNILLQNGYGAAFNMHPYYFIVYAVLYVASRIGLIFFKKWARVSFLFIVLLGVTSSPFLGVSVQASFESLLGYVVVLSDGAILALIYFSKLADEY